MWLLLLSIVVWMGKRRWPHTSQGYHHLEYHNQCHSIFLPGPYSCEHKIPPGCNYQDLLVNAIGIIKDFIHTVAISKPSSMFCNQTFEIIHFNWVTPVGNLLVFYWFYHIWHLWFYFFKSMVLPCDKIHFQQLKERTSTCQPSGVFLVFHSYFGTLTFLKFFGIR